MDAEWIQIIPQQIHRYFGIILYKLPTDFLDFRNVSRILLEVPMKMPIFSKCLKKYTCARYLDGVCRDSWVLANSARDVKEVCDS